MGVKDFSVIVKYNPEKEPQKLKLLTICFHSYRVFILMTDKVLFPGDYGKYLEGDNGLNCLKLHVSAMHYRDCATA